MKWAVYQFKGDGTDAKGRRKTLWQKLPLRIVFPEVVRDTDVLDALKARGLEHTGVKVRGNGDGTIDVTRGKQHVYRLLNEPMSRRYDDRERQAKHRGKRPALWPW